MKPSSFLNINWQDLLKGLIMSVAGAVVAIIGPSIESLSFVFDWTLIWHTAAAAGFAYLVKQFFTPEPKTIQIDPSKTTVVDADSKFIISNAKN